MSEQTPPREHATTDDLQIHPSFETAASPTAERRGAVLRVAGHGLFDHGGGVCTTVPN